LYYRYLVNEIKTRYLIRNRPVILFFENNQELNKFANSEEFNGNKYQILNERANNKEKSILVLRATQAKTITLSTKNFGRGTDFCCYDKEVIDAGGLVVIQTFLSEDLSEET
jgi:preprotein translocase subunit SecA